MYDDYNTDPISLQISLNIEQYKISELKEQINELQQENNKLKEENEKLKDEINLLLKNTE